jgi:hypothetical protein
VVVVAALPDCAAAERVKTNIHTLSRRSFLIVIISARLTVPGSEAADFRCRWMSIMMLN